MATPALDLDIPRDALLSATPAHRRLPAAPPGAAPILFVDDNDEILECMARQLQRKYLVHVANSGARALAVIQESGPFPVVISDYRMPGMGGVELLARIRDVAPETVRVMLTGAADLDAAIEAINSGEVFRFLTKPTPGDALERTINAAIEQHRLITSQRILLSETLHGSIKMLTDLLALTSPETFGHATRVKSLAGELAVEMQVSPRWELEIAAMMSFVGFLTLPPEIVHKTFSLQPLRDDERALFEGYPATSRNVIANIPRMEGVARLIEFHNRDLGPASPAAPAGAAREAIPLGSRILKAASDFQILIANVPDRETALQRMRASTRYDPAVLAALQTVVSRKSVQVTEVPIQELRAGLVMAEDLFSSNGKTLLLARGQELSDFLVQRLRNFFQQHAADAVVAVVNKG